MSAVRLSYLEKFKSNKTPIFVYLTNGIKLTGFVSDYDETVIILGRDDGSTQMIERSAISTVGPQ